ncbi:hypothetical protein F5B19DRAFT_160342 [Rostrohypoxylon terebratum]|nr:hypothetical protein F5B19DRAFT_160342 [Rostrohypoxylon terebratum]
MNKGFNCQVGRIKNQPFQMFQMFQLSFSILHSTLLVLFAPRSFRLLLSTSPSKQAIFIFLYFYSLYRYGSATRQSHTYSPTSVCLVYMHTYP